MAIPSLTNVMLGTYLLATLPCRKWAERLAARHGRAPVVILFYHRVADEHPNAWTMSRACFQWQIDWLQRRFDLVSLAEAQRRISTANHRTCVSITFDDGYADNCDFALPLLIERGIPCTYFVTTNNVLRGEYFGHDLDAGVPLKPNTACQLRELAAAGIELGAHTQTHTDLGKVSDPQRLHAEIVEAGRELAEAIGKPVRYFAFPFGLHANLSAAALEVARRAGYQAVCSAYGAYNLPGDDPFHLRRVHADPEVLRFKNWLTLDPRKLALRRQPNRTELGGSVQSRTGRVSS